MNIYCICLLLLLALLTCSEGPQHTKLFDPSVCPIELNSTIAQLGVLAPGLPQNEVFRNDLPQNEVFRSDLPQYEVFRSDLPQNEVFRSDLPQTEVFKFILPQ